MATRSLDTLLGSYPAEVQRLALAARSFILRSLPGAQETVDGSAPVIGYGYGAGYKGIVCTLLLSKTGVKLGLARGAELPDPDRLLEGTGKVHRYVRLRTAASLEHPGLARLVKAARAGMEKRAH